ncbi:alpha-E domain-containing protein [Kaarinaea lacus]
MLSRVAERVYWMSRYAERAENIARIINVYTNLLLDLPRNTTIGWHSLVQITGNEKLYREFYQDNLERHIIKFLLADTRNPDSLFNSLSYARENARTIRDILPREGWEHLNELYLKTKAELPSGLSRRNRFELLDSLIGSVQQLTGLLAGTMIHNSGYHFVRIGRNLERADMTSRLLDTITMGTFVDGDQEQISPYDYALCMNVLKSLSAYQSYRQQESTAISRAIVQKFVLQNNDFPRAVLHCLYEIQNSIQKLPRHITLIRHLNRIIRVVETTNIAAFNSKQLHRFIDILQRDIGSFHQYFSDTYFAVLQIPARHNPGKNRKKSNLPKHYTRPTKESALQPSAP